MKFLSVCSGIEAASVAWHPLGWKAVAYSEIEPFPCSVLAHHYPDTPNWGDMTKYKDWPDVSIDLLCGGTPCQSFSVAGLRKGLDDPRGNLMLTFGAIAAKYRPKWLVWENVPGVLSSNGGRDFGSFLGLLGELGYGFAYRVLDAQYFGVPQRRRRVFVVGCFGDWQSAAAVLFERHSLSGHPAPSRQARESTSQGIEFGPAGGRFTDVNPTLDTRAKDGPIRNQLAGAVAVTQAAYALQHAQIAPTMDQRAGRSGANSFATSGGLIPVRTLCVATGQAGAEIGADMAPTLNCNHEAPYIGGAMCKDVYSGGMGGRVDAAVQGYALPIHDMATRHAGTDGSGNQNGKGHGLGIGGTQDPMYTLTKGDKHAIAYRVAGDGAVYTEGDKTAPLTTATDPCANVVAVALRGREGRATAELGDDQAFALRASQGGGDKPYVMAYSTKLHNTTSNNAGKIFEERTVALDANSPPPALLTAMQVRRLTPLETERLQGFPDGYTAVPHRGKPAADGPRYKSHGNSWAVPCITWIGRRIEAVEAITQQRKAA